MVNKLVLFDIDGTLLSVDHRRMRSMISELLTKLDLAGIDHSAIPFAGRTDRAIFSDLMGPAALDRNLFNEVQNRYVKELEQSVQPDWVEVHTGAEETIAWCTSQNIAYGLLTGNFEDAAYIKLKKANLDHHFEFGAFGCEHSDRNALPEIAHRKAEIHFGRSFRAEDIIIIGDTPNDVACARHYQTRCIAVTTGPFSESELNSHKPDLILSSLENPHNWFHDFLRTS